MASVSNYSAGSTGATAYGAPAMADRQIKLDHELLRKMVRFVNRLGSELLCQASERNPHVSALNPPFILATLLVAFNGGIDSSAAKKIASFYEGIDSSAAKKMQDMILHGPPSSKEKAAQEKGEHEIKLKAVSAKEEVIPPELILRAFAELKEMMTFRGEGLTYALYMNALALNAASDVTPRFRHLIEGELKAKLFRHSERGNIGPWLINEAPPELKEMIGKAASGDILAPGPSGSVDLFSCALFSTFWEELLSEEFTKDADFLCSNGRRICVKAMEGEIKKARACFVDGHTVVVLPYKGHKYHRDQDWINMEYVLIIPHDPLKIRDTEKSAHEIIEKSREFLNQTTRIYIRLPKQDLFSDEDRLKDLIAAGYPLEAPMTGIMPSSSGQVPRIVQIRDRVIGTIDEKGARAAVVARGGVSKGFSRPTMPLYVEALQPFVGCVVVNNSRIGRISVLTTSIKNERLVVSGAGNSAQVEFTHNAIPPISLESEQWRTIMQPIAHLTRNPVRSAVEYTFRKNAGAELRISLVNYSSKQVEVNIAGELLVGGSQVWVKMDDDEYAHPNLYFNPVDIVENLTIRSFIIELGPDLVMINGVNQSSYSNSWLISGGQARMLTPQEYTKLFAS